MSTNEGTLFDRIPKNKLAELANGFSADTTAQQAVQALAALGIEATEEEAQALLGSLFVKKGSLKPLGNRRRRILRPRWLLLRRWLVHSNLRSFVLRLLIEPTR